jgi:hypothetical protein
LSVVNKHIPLKVLLLILFVYTLFGTVSHYQGKEKIDVTAFMVWFIENYPESVKVIKENPDYQHRFK